MKLTPYQQYIHLSRYARFRDDLGRRETWDETVDRVYEFWLKKIPTKLHKQLKEAMEAVRRMEVMPSMRVMMTAGPALDAHHVAGYNCAYTTIDHPKKFSEILYILMCGTGVGFSVERDYVNKLPEVPEELYESDSIINVRDSKLGWSSAYREVIQMLYGGRIPKWDTSKVRPSGSRLKTFGGRASGPEPLEGLFRFTIETFKAAKGRQLTTLECHDLVCKIADIVVVGGVRRAALISLSNLTDERMRGAKAGDWYNTDPHRMLSNNSVAYTCKPDTDSYLKEMTNLYISKSGERGLFSRNAAQRKYTGDESRRDSDWEFGTNPCSEIILRPSQFCNLTEIIARPGDNLGKLIDKARHASFLGTLQATLTNFKFLSKDWKVNCEDERLLGVSITGILDHPILGGQGNEGDVAILIAIWLPKLKDIVIETNKQAAKALKINQATATTCVKPSGTVSQLCNTASGIHPRYAEHYIRRVKNDNKDPICQVLIGAGVPHEPDQSNPHCTIFTFPMTVPEGAITQDDISALEHLKLWEIYNEHWCEHKPSVTISYKDEEFIDLMGFIYRNFDSVSGISLLPRTEHIYIQAPYEAVSGEVISRLQSTFPVEIDWSKLNDIETGDNTSVQPELACSAGVCEL